MYVDVIDDGRHRGMLCAVAVIGTFHPPVEQIGLVKVLAALADPARIATVRALARAGECSCNRLQDQAGLEISRSTFSHHQRILREAGLIRVRLSGAERMLSLRTAELDARFPGLLSVVLDSPGDALG